MRHPAQKNLYPGSDVIRKYSFTAAGAWDKSATMAKLNHIMSASAGKGWGNYAYFSITPDCFECRSPWIYKAA